jgi:hypothetical protein
MLKVAVMKVLLQHINTGLFFKQIGDWTDDCNVAREFPNSLNAINFCNANGLRDVHVLLKFQQPRYDVSLPVLNRNPPA